MYSLPVVEWAMQDFLSGYLSFFKEG